MCELLGMECNVPTDIVFSFSGLSLRGGLKGPHRDGWGLALYDGRAARIFREPSAAAHSELARFVRDAPIKTLLAIAHVRRRSRGPVSLANTHPFERELWGRQVVFAHNGTVRGARALRLGAYRPVGTTDSEYAFCSLLGELRETFGGYPRSPPAYFKAVARAAGRIGRAGTFNFLMADGTYLFARCATRLHHIVRTSPFRHATLADDELCVDFSQVTTPNDRVAVVATVPLTRDEQWIAGEPNTLWVFQRGALIATLASD